MTLRRLFMLATGLILLLLTSVVFWLLNTSAGTAASLRLLQSAVPELEIRGIKGSWSDGLQLDALVWRSPDTLIGIEDISLKLHIQDLLVLKVNGRYLTAGQLFIELMDPGEAGTSPIQLPKVASPIEIRLGKLNIGVFQVRRGEKTLFQTPLKARKLQWQVHKIQFDQAILSIANTQVNGQGSIALRGGYPLTLTAALSNNQLQEKVRVEARGSLEQLDLKASVAGRYPMNLSAALQLLETGLPFNGALNLDKPLEIVIAEHPLMIEKGRLEFTGDLESQSGQLRADIREESFGSSALSADLKLAWPELTLSQLQLRAGESRIENRCNIRLLEWQWDCSGDITNLPLTPWTKLTASLSSRFSTQGAYTEDQQHFVVTLDAMAGTVNNYGLTGELQLERTQEKTWLLPNLKLSIGGNYLEAHGALGGRSELKTLWQLDNLNALSPEVEGAIRGTVTFSGNLPAPDAAGRLQATNVSWRGLRLAYASLSGEIKALGEKNSALQLSAQGLDSPRLSLASLDLELAGTRKNHQLSVEAEGAEQHQALALSCNGNLAETRWLADCNQLNGQYPLFQQAILFSLREKTAINWQWGTKDQEQQLAVTPFCLQLRQDTQHTEACLANGLQVKGSDIRTRFSIGKFPLTWLPLPLPTDFQLNPEATLDAWVDLDGTAPLKGNGHVAFQQMTWQWQVNGQPVEGGLQNLQADFEAGPQLAQLHFTASSRRNANFKGTLNVADPGSSRILSGHIESHIPDINEFAWLVDEVITMQGKADMSVTLAGTLEKPALDGRLDISGKQLLLDRIGEPVTDFDLNARFNGSGISYQGSFQLGGGRGQLNGHGNWIGDYLLSSNQVALTAVDWSLPEGGNALFDADINLSTGENLVTTSGSIDIHKAHLMLDTLPPGGASVSADTVVLGAPARQLTTFETSLKVNLGNNLRLTGFGADFLLAGQLQLQSDRQQLNRVIGAVRVTQGKYKAYGQTLKVTHGQLRFNGPWDNPELQMEAIRPNTVDQIAGIRVSGTLREPESELFSEPAMSETDTAYFLVTGQKRQGTGLGEMSADAALLSLGVNKFSGGAAKIAEELGIGDFQVSTSQTEYGTAAQVSGFITPRLFARYGPANTYDDENGTSSVTLQYRLTPRIIIESISGFNSALDIFYSFEID